MLAYGTEKTGQNALFSSFKNMKKAMQVLACCLVAVAMWCFVHHKNNNVATVSTVTTRTSVQKQNKPKTENSDKAVAYQVTVKSTFADQ